MAVSANARASFQRRVEPHRRELHAHCYRMLGSVHDAEDALQEAMLRAWRGIDRFEERSSLRSWLFRIATNTCLDLIAKRRRRALPVDFEPSDPSLGPGEPLSESTWVEPYADEAFGVEDGFAAPEARYERREAVELAFIAALQHLPPNQRAALILRDVLGFSARESAEMLDTSVASINSALQRARAAMEERHPEQSQQETLRSLGDDEIRELVERYIDAWDRGDVDAVVTMLAADATFSMPPNVEWFRGREVIRDFLPRGPLSIPRRFVRARANGQLAFGTYKLEDGEWLATAIHVITLDASGAITDAIAFLDASLFPRFGLPPVPQPSLNTRESD